MEERKFRVGDRVRLTAKAPRFLGAEAIIVEKCEEESAFDWRVDIGGDGDSDVMSVFEHEIELVESAPADAPAATMGVIEELAKLLDLRADGYDIYSENIEAAIFIERRHGTTEAMEYLREALKGAERSEVPTDGGNV